MHDKVYLFADIEEDNDTYDDNNEFFAFRIELLEFELDTTLTFSEANLECRERYCGGIYFIEYNSVNESRTNVLKDFLSLFEKMPKLKQAIYLLCEDDELKDILKEYPDNVIYVMTN